MSNIKSLKVKDSGKEDRNTRIHFFPTKQWENRATAGVAGQYPKPRDKAYRDACIEGFRRELGMVFKRAKAPKDVKARWSQVAGCSCGCSPGFICTGWKGKDVFVSLG